MRCWDSGSDSALTGPQSQLVLWEEGRLDNIDAKDGDGNLLLHNACAREREDLVQALLEQHARRHALNPYKEDFFINKRGQSPLHVLLQQNGRYNSTRPKCVKIAKMLVEDFFQKQYNGLPDAEGNTPFALSLECTRSSREAPLRQLLFSAAVDHVATQDEPTRTTLLGELLCSVARHGHVVFMCYLLNEGCSVNFKDREGYTALQRAKEAGRSDVVALLEQAGAQ